MPSIDGGKISEGMWAGEGSGEWSTWAQMFGWCWVAAMGWTGGVEVSRLYLRL